MEADDKYTEDGQARWMKENGESAERPGGAEGPLTTIGGGNDDKISSEERLAIQFGILKDIRGLGDNSILM